MAASLSFDSESDIRNLSFSPPSSLNSQWSGVNTRHHLSLSPLLTPGTPFALTSLPLAKTALNSLSGGVQPGGYYAAGADIPGSVGQGGSRPVRPHGKQPANIHTVRG